MSERDSALGSAGLSVLDEPHMHVFGIHAFLWSADGERLLLGSCGKTVGGRASGERWGTPGGRTEPRETPRVTIVRELREELGIEVEPAGVEECYCLELCRPGQGPCGLELRVNVRRWSGEPEADGVELRRIRWFNLREAEERLRANPWNVDSAQYLAGEIPSRAVVRWPAIGQLPFMRGPSHDEAAARRGVASARATGDAGREASNRIRLATALQYAGSPDEALAEFDAVIASCEAGGAETWLHHALQHRGKCLVEVRRADDGRADLERALALRRDLGDADLLASTRTALEELDRLQASHVVGSPSDPGSNAPR